MRAGSYVFCEFGDDLPREPAESACVGIDDERQECQALLTALSCCPLIGALVVLIVGERSSDIPLRPSSSRQG